MSGDTLAGWLAARKQPPHGRVHLHAFVKKGSLVRCAVYEDGTSEPQKYRHQLATPIRTVLDGELDWRVSTRASSVCKIPGRCILADIIEEAQV